MGILDDTAVFVAVVQQGGFSHAAKHLGLSNGLISRRIAQLEASLGATLLTRTTRQQHLTAEGEVFFSHAQRIQQELDSAISLIQSSSKKPKGHIRISAPLYFGRYYLTPIILKFLKNFPEITFDLLFTNQKIDPVKWSIDLVIRGAGYLAKPELADSNMQMKNIFSEKIGLYASPDYLAKSEKIETCFDLSKHSIIINTDPSRFSKLTTWTYQSADGNGEVVVNSKLNFNDIESGLLACISGFGVGKFTELNVQTALQHKQLVPVLTQYDWGEYHLFAIYPQQKSLPKRTRLLLDFIQAHTKYFLSDL